MKTQDKVAKLDKGLRHKSGVKQEEFVKHYCGVFAGSAYATRDDSWNEFEKTITHVLGMYMYYRRFCEIMGFPGVDGDSFDPRDFVQGFEDEQEELSKLMTERAGQLMESKSISGRVE